MVSAACKIAHGMALMKGCEGNAVAQAPVPAPANRMWVAIDLLRLALAPSARFALTFDA